MSFAFILTLTIATDFPVFDILDQVTESDNHFEKVLKSEILPVFLTAKGLYVITSVHLLSILNRVPSLYPLSL
jgi:hypothetical protein